MKSQFQTLSFLSNYSPKSELDLEMIASFLEKRHKIAPKHLTFSSQPDAEALDVQSFLQWFESGYGASDIAVHNNAPVILGNCTYTTATVIGTISDNAINLCQTPIPVSELTQPTPEQAQSFQKALLNNLLQFNQETLTLTHKYIPSPNEKIIFHSNDFSIKGIGVVREVNHDTQKIELYCYFIYPGVHTERQIGYSMHETGVVNLHEYIFEPMLDDDKRFSKMNGVSCLRRLNTELAKHGKVWKDKIHRIEPVQIKSQEGKPYWYINDKLEVTQSMEKGTPTSHFRYLCGNYFTSNTNALVMQQKIRELIQSYLASPEWPDINP